MAVAVLLFILGLLMLIKGGDWFVDGATRIAKGLGVPEILIGATVVSIGTTLPEVMVSAASAYTGHGEIAYGNAIGSIICNTALISAITMAIRPQKVDKKSFLTPVVFFFISAAVYVAIAYITGYFARETGVILLLIFVVYMAFTIAQSRASSEETADSSGLHPEPVSKKKVATDLALLIIGAALIAFGADLLVDNGTIIAEKLGVPESVIALTFVALGTSLPELVTAISSLVKGHSALSLGNIIGANLFNIVLVNGISSVISPFSIPVSKQLLGHNSSLAVDIPLMATVMLILTVPCLISGKIRRWQGILLLGIYISFVAYQFII